MEDGGVADLDAERNPGVLRRGYFSLARALVPKWNEMAGSTRDHHDPGLFFRGLGGVFNQILGKVEVSDHVARPEARDANSLVCQQIKIGRIRVASGYGMRGSGGRSRGGTIFLGESKVGEGSR